MAVGAHGARFASHRGEGESGVRSALLAAGALLAGLAVVWLLAELVPVVRAGDARLLARAVALRGASVETSCERLLSTLEYPYALLWGAAIVAVALARGLPRLALAAAAVMILAPASADLLKPILAHAHDRAGSTRVGAASWPSGHAAASMALVCALGIAVPRRVLPYVVLGGGVYVLAVAAALLILAWHMPSDVVGGWLLAGLWTSLAVASLRLARRRWPEQRRW
jgi:membrane-associated phospholipid phosphatase